MVLYASITWLHTNGFTITYLHQFPWFTAMVIDAHWTMPHTDGLSECYVVYIPLCPLSKIYGIELIQELLPEIVRYCPRLQMTEDVTRLSHWL